MFGTALGHRLGVHAGLVGWEGVRLRFTVLVYSDCQSAMAVV